MKFSPLLAVSSLAFADIRGRDVSQLQTIISPVRSSIDEWHTATQSWVTNPSGNQQHLIDSGSNFYEALDKAATDLGTTDAIDPTSAAAFTPDFHGMIVTVKDTLSAIKGCAVSGDARNSVKDNLDMQQHHWAHLSNSMQSKLPEEAQSEFNNDMKDVMNAYADVSAAFSGKDVAAETATVTVSVITVTVTPTACGAADTTAGAAANSHLSDASKPSSTQGSPVAFTGAANAMTAGLGALAVGVGAMILI